MEGEEILQIDVKSIIGSKNPKTLKRIPRFVIKYLERIIHQKTINEYLRSVPDKKDMEFVRETIKFMELSIVYEGLENVEEKGCYVFASNHPLGGLESLVLMHIVSQKFKDIVFVVNDLLMALKPMSNLFVPVNKLGTQSRESVKKINDAYASDKQVLYFPAGLVSRKIKGEIVDPPWQKTFVSKAIEAKRDIVPVYIEGRNSNFFYRLAKIRKFFRIKTNIEMLYLVDEMYKQKGRTIKVKFGTPVPYKTFDKSKSYKEWAEFLRLKAYGLNAK